MTWGDSVFLPVDWIQKHLPCLSKGSWGDLQGEIYADIDMILSGSLFPIKWLLQSRSCVLSIHPLGLGHTTGARYMCVEWAGLGEVERQAALCPTGNVLTSSEFTSSFKRWSWTSLVVQWLRICLPMRGTRVWSLVWEDPTCCSATKPVCHSYWCPCALEPVHEKPVPWEARAPQLESSPLSPQLEKARVQPWRPRAAKNK